MQLSFLRVKKNFRMKIKNFSCTLDNENKFFHRTLVTLLYAKFSNRKTY